MYTIDKVQSVIHEAYAEMCDQLHCTANSPISLDSFKIVVEIFVENQHNLPIELSNLLWQIHDNPPVLDTTTLIYFNILINSIIPF